MISIKSDSKIDGLIILFDKNGIDEMIEYLNFIKSKEPSMHLVSGTELSSNNAIENYFDVPHLKIINVNLLNEV